MATWNLPDTEIKTIRESLVASGKKTDQMLTYQNRQAILNQELKALETELEYFNQYNNHPDMKKLNFPSFSPISADTILAILLKYQRNMKNGGMTFGEKLYNFFAYGIYNFKFYNNSSEEIICLLQQMYYDKRLQELRSEINQLSSRLRGYQFNKEIKIASTNAMKEFKAMLEKRFNDNSNRCTCLIIR